MIHILRLILTQMVLSLRSRAELQIENLALQHQIEILKRTAPIQPKSVDRSTRDWLASLRNPGSEKRQGRPRLKGTHREGKSVSPKSGSVLLSAMVLI